MLCFLVGSLSDCTAPQAEPITVQDSTRCCASSAISAFSLLHDGVLSTYIEHDNLIGLLPDKEEGISLAALGWDHMVLANSSGVMFQSATTEAKQPSLSSDLQARTSHEWVPISLGVPKRILQLAAGEKHSLALTEEGAVLAWGSNCDGQLGVGLDASVSSHSQPALAFGPGSRAGGGRAGKNIACGARHSCVVTCEGEVWCWGWSLHGQCATAAPMEPLPVQVQALVGVAVATISGGLAHTLVSSRDGDVYSWGWNGDGQLGHGDYTNRFTPTLVESIGQESAIRKVSCGARHSVVLTEAGQVLGCGCNRHAELGLAEKKVPFFTPLGVPALKTKPHRVVDLECGWWHTVILAEPEMKS